MKKLIMIIMYLTFCVPIIWTQTHQIKDAIQIGSVKENNLDTSLVVNVTKEQVQDLVINSYLSKDEIDNKIMKTKIIWGITLRTLHIRCSSYYFMCGSRCVVLSLFTIEY